MGNCTSSQCTADHSTYTFSCPKCERGLEIDYEKRRINELSGKLLRTAPWVPDQDRQTCQDCHSKFSFRLRKHHCRVCNDIFCDDCSSLSIGSIVSLNGFIDTSRSESLRVCRSCFKGILFVHCEHCLFEFCLSCNGPWHETSVCPPKKRQAVLNTMMDFNGGVLVYPATSNSDLSFEQEDDRSEPSRHRSSHRSARSSEREDAADMFEIRCVQCRKQFSDSYRAHKTNARDGSLLLCGKSRWIPDAERSVCGICFKGFSVLRKRHHCRICGDVYCGACSDISMEGYDMEEKEAESELRALLKTQPLKGAKITVTDAKETENMQRVCHSCLQSVMRVECPECEYAFCMYCEAYWMSHAGKFCEV